MINKLLNTETINYTSNLNRDSLRQKIEGVFEQSNSSFVGKFTSPNDFEAYDKWTFFNWQVPNFKRKTAYLNGELIKSGDGTLLKLRFKPNPVIAIFPILSILIGLITIIVAMSNHKTLIFGFIIIAVGILFYLFGMFLRNRLQNNFMSYLE